MTRPVKVCIDRDALRHNLVKIRQFSPNSKIMAIVKANAYGHGLDTACNAFAEADALGLLELEDAIRLRQSGIKQRICLLEGFFAAGEIPAFIDNQLEPVIHAEWQIELLEKSTINGRLTVWLKIDTGMNRLGFPAQDAAHAMERLRAVPGIGSISIMSHLANAEHPDPNSTLRQFHKFQSATEHLETHEKSLANSAAIVSHPDCHLDTVRPGIMLYGASPFEDRTASDLGLKPVMQLSSEIIAIKNLHEGDAIGYGSTWVCPEDMRIAVIACGYGDGYPRHAVAGTPVSIAGVEAGLVGRVSMDMITVDLRGIEQANVGSPVELWGSQVPVDTVARMSGTISYELLCGITNRVRREVNSNG